MRRLLLLAFLGSALATQPALANVPNADDVMLHSVGEFQLLDREPATILRHAADKPFRVCVRERLAIPNVPVSVRHDGRTDTVEPGSCLEGTAHTLRVGAAEPLPHGVELIGRLVQPRR